MQNYRNAKWRKALWLSFVFLVENKRFWRGCAHVLQSTILCCSARLWDAGDMVLRFLQGGDSCAGQQVCPTALTIDKNYLPRRGRSAAALQFVYELTFARV